MFYSWFFEASFHIWMNMKILRRHGLMLQYALRRRWSNFRLIDNFRGIDNFRRIEIFEKSSTKPFIRIKMTDMNFLFSISELKFLMNFHKNFLIYFESAHAFLHLLGSKNDSKYINHMLWTKSKLNQINWKWWFSMRKFSSPNIFGHIYKLMIFFKLNIWLPMTYRGMTQIICHNVSQRVTTPPLPRLLTSRLGGCDAGRKPVPWG